MTHEVGHNFGLGHANARNCVVGGTRVTIAADASCTTQTYADPFSTMGNNALRHNHGSQLGELGWLDASQKVVGTPGNTYTISPYLGDAARSSWCGSRAATGASSTSTSARPYGSFDNFAAGSPAVSGATIRLGWGTASPTGSPQATELLDTTPSTTDLKDAPLLVGRSITDPVSDDLVHDPVDRQRRRDRPGHRGHRAGCARIAGRDRGQRAEREPRLECRERQRRGRLLPGDPRRLDGRDPAGHGPRLVRPRRHRGLDLRLRRRRGRHLRERRRRRDEDRRCPRGRADPDTDPHAHAGPDADPRADAHTRADPDTRPHADPAARRRRTDRARAAHRHAHDDDRQPRVGRGVR